jgi:thioredoxin 1
MIRCKQIKKFNDMKMLQTGLHEIETADELQKIISENENVMVCCGRMGPMCIPVYDAMEELGEERDDVKFYSMAFDNSEAHAIRNAPEARGFMGLPFTMYYKNGKVTHATSSIQSMDQITNVLNIYFKESVH